MNNMLVAANSQITTMSSREIAELTGKQHRNVKADIERMFQQLDEDALRFQRIYYDGLNRQQSEYCLPYRECEILITGYDVKRRAAVIDRWYDLETGKAQPAISHQAPMAELVQAADIMASALRLEGSARIVAMRSFSAANCPQLLPMIPDYAIDAPTVAGGAESSLPTESATTLLKRFDEGMRTTAFNKLCESAGLLEQKSRVSSKGKTIKFWCVTENGLQYGKNVTSTQSPLQTQPHWYSARFSELLAQLSQEVAA